MTYLEPNPKDEAEKAPADTPAAPGGDDPDSITGNPQKKPERQKGGDEELGDEQRS